MRRLHWLGLIAALLLTAFAYRQLPGRSFAADDFQWLLRVRGLSLAELLRAAFDSGAQAHFFRPAIWLLFWLQERGFGLRASGFHAASFALHAANAVLLALLLRHVVRLPRAAFVLAAALILIHPAPFEAVVWVSGQSDLLAALWLLLMLHCWLRPGPLGVIGATVCYALALLTKETAIIGLPLLLLCLPLRNGGTPARDARDARVPRGWSVAGGRWSVVGGPLFITALYLAAQLRLERQNYLVTGGGYGFGPQLLLNPLRSLALLTLPLPGTEHAAAAWLPWVGALLLALLAAAALRATRRGRWQPLLALLALLVTLAPTAPFASPPDSRYFYIPLLAFVVLLGIGTDERHRLAVGRRSMVGGRRSVVAILLTSLLLLTLTAETSAREARFAAAAGPGASLFALAQQLCAGPPLNRMLLVEPPLPAEQAQAAVALACGERPRPLVVSREQVAAELRSNSVVVSFPGGSATLEPGR